ncbi:methyltransferase domain-containing protein [Streptomyces sp. NPDC005423]|uniref:class I SAM-dependent methyltransferase n=1 Tax=Streptomyces sp. NPDC005423 TaxID=3155343 RepID=UPI0033B4E725
MNSPRTRVHALGERRRHRAAARAVLRLLPEPESWLDVGTGDGRFPGTAKEYFPYTSFDGVDPSPRVLRARASERVEEAYAGDLTDPRLLAVLRARYDVVSLLRDRSQAPDPDTELRAALAVLRPGGLLLVESPHPRPPALRDCALIAVSRRLGDRFPPVHLVLARKAPEPPRATPTPRPGTPWLY